MTTLNPSYSSFNMLDYANTGVGKDLIQGLNLGGSNPLMPGMSKFQTLANWRPTALENISGSLPNVAANASPAGPSLWSQLGGTSMIGDNPTFLQNMMGGIDKHGNKLDGWGGGALNLASAIGSGFMNFKNYDLAKDALRDQQKNFNKQFGMQKKLINQQIDDRNAARLARHEGDESKFHKLENI